MTVTDLEKIKKKAELTSKGIQEITDEINSNKVIRDTVRKLVEARKNFETSKKYLAIPAACVIATAVSGIFCFLASVPIHFIPVALSCALPMTLIFTGYSVSNYFLSKRAFKKLATNENLELENNIEETIIRIVTLEELLSLAQAKLATCNELIEYFSEYNDKVSLLESTLQEINIPNDSLASSDNTVIPEGVQVKKLTN